MPKRAYKKGDLLFRFKFNLHTGKVERDVFRVVDVIERGTTSKVKTEYAGSDSAKALFQHAYFEPDSEIGVVKTKGTCKYVLMDDDVPDEARKIVLGYLKGRKAELGEQVNRLGEWIDAIEKFLSEQEA